MFAKLTITNYPPTDKALMVYDGNCGFCKYWVIKWKKLSGFEVEFKPYQEVASQFKDIESHHFKEAVRYIATDGRIYNGPNAAYITYYNQSRYKFLHAWYVKKEWFQKFSDHVYQWVADHRDFMSKLSIRMFGKNPANPKPYWKIYLLTFLLIIVSLVFLSLTNI